MGRCRFGKGWDELSDDRTIQDHDGEVPRALWSARRGRLWRAHLPMHDGPFDPDKLHHTSDIVMNNRSFRDVLRVAWQFRLQLIPCFDPHVNTEARRYHRTRPDFSPGRVIDWVGAALDFWQAEFPGLTPFAVEYGNEVGYMKHYTSDVLAEFNRYARGFEQVGRTVGQVWPDMPIVVAGRNYRDRNDGLPSLAWWFGEQVRMGHIDIDPDRVVLGWHASGGEDYDYIRHGTRQLRGFGLKVAVTESVGEGPNDLERYRGARDGGAWFYIAWGRLSTRLNGWTNFGDTAVECVEQYESTPGSNWSEINATAFSVAGKEAGEWNLDLQPRDYEPPPPDPSVERKALREIVRRARRTLDDTVGPRLEAIGVENLISGPPEAARRVLNRQLVHLRDPDDG